jgi:Kdo2-lipid IVA lauroyltransferase/acyltransferase
VTLAKLFLGNRLRKRVDSSPLLRWMRWAIEAGVLAGLWRASARMTPERASETGQRLLRWLGPRLHKTRHFRRNLALAFPDSSEAEIDRLVRETWGNSGAVLAEYPHLGEIRTGRTETVVKFDVDSVRDCKRRAIFVAAHLANWEIAAAAAAQFGVPLTVVYTPQENPWVDRMLHRHRSALGCKLVARDDAMRVMVRELTAGRSIGLLVDQRVDSGVPVPFFGIDKLTTLVPARLALRFECDLIPVRVERLPGARFRVTAHEPVRCADATLSDHDRALEMTRRINAVFEEWIREFPEQWFCSNRRWAKTATPPLPGYAGQPAAAH